MSHNKESAAETDAFVENRHDQVRDNLRRPADPTLHARLGCKETTVRKFVRLGLLRGVVVNGVLRVPDSAVDDFIERAKHGDLA